jgi:N-acetylmuramic acid 6-phosphate etherase
MYRKNAEPSKTPGGEIRLTEQPNPRSARIDQLSTLEIVDLINAEDRMVAEAVAEERREIAHCVDLVVESFRQGGRLIYVGPARPAGWACWTPPRCRPPTGRTRPWSRA